MDINSVLINEGESLIQAMKILDQTAKKILFIEIGDKLVASITDGDIRRWILEKGTIDASVKDVANYNPKFMYQKDRFKAKRYMKQNGIEALPLLDDNKKIISIVFLNEDEIKSSNKLDIPVVIMAGGLGTRLYPYTKILPKSLIPIGELPIAEHIINRFNKYGCDRFYLIVNHKKNMIKAYFNEIKKKYEVVCIDEDKPLGTGGGLSLLKNKINSTLILTNSDILIEDDYENIYQHHKKEKNLITMVCSLKKFKIPYGVIEIGENGKIDMMEEKPELSFFINTGCYIVEPKVIEEMEEETFIGFPDIIDKYKSKGEKIGIYPISENSWMDMGQIDEMEEMIKRLDDER